MECACIGDKPENVQLCGLHYWAAKKFAATAEQERDFLRREVESLREQCRQRLEIAALKLRSVVAQRDELLKIIADGRAFEPPPPIIIQQSDTTKLEQERDEGR